MNERPTITDRRRMAPAQAQAPLAWCAVAVVVLLAVEGMRSRGGSTGMLLGLAPIVALPTVVATVGCWVLRATHLAKAAFVLLPVAAGVLTVTWLVGWVVFPGVLAWWLAGALVCAMPFVVLANATRTARDPGRSMTSRFGSP